MFRGFYLPSLHSVSLCGLLGIKMNPVYKKEEESKRLGGPKKTVTRYLKNGKVWRNCAWARDLHGLGTHIFSFRKGEFENLIVWAFWENLFLSFSIKQFQAWWYATYEKLPLENRNFIKLKNWLHSFLHVIPLLDMK